MKDRLGDEIRLQHIIDSIVEIETYTQGIRFEEFKNNSMMLNASLRQLEIIGEAANRLSDGIIIENSSIPWKNIIGLRNMIIHEYFGVDNNMIWNVIKNNLPDFKKQIEMLLLQIDKQV